MLAGALVPICILASMVGGGGLVVPHSLTLDMVRCGILPI